MTPRADPHVPRRRGRREGPLFVDPALFASHLDCIVESGASVLTVTELAPRLRRGTGRSPGRRNVVITFDDGVSKASLALAAPCSPSGGFAQRCSASPGTSAGRATGRRARPGLRRSSSRMPRSSPGSPARGGRSGLARDGSSHRSAGSPARKRPSRGDPGASGAARGRRSAHRGLDCLAWPYGVPPGRGRRRGSSRRSMWPPAAGGLSDGVTSSASDAFALARVDAHYPRDPGLRASGDRWHARSAASRHARSLRVSGGSSGTITRWDRQA